MEVFLSLVTHAVAAVAGAFVWVKVSPIMNSWLASHKAKSALANAQAVLKAEEARVAALAQAHATVAAQTQTSAAAAGTPSPTGPTAPVPGNPTAAA